MQLNCEYKWNLDSRFELEFVVYLLLDASQQSYRMWRSSDIEETISVQFAKFSGRIGQISMNATPDDGSFGNIDE